MSSVMAIPKVQAIRNENYVLWGKKCACGYRVRVGHNVLSQKLPGGHVFVEHVDCLLDHLAGRGRGLRRESGWASCAMGVECLDLFNEDVSYWRADNRTTFRIHRTCLKHLIRGWARSPVPILQKHIDAELAQLTGG